MFTVMDGVATPLHGAASAIEAQGDVLVWNGWQAAFKNVTKTTIQWTQGSDTMVWHRFDAASGVDALVGHWKNTEGLLCDVDGGVCTFTAKNAQVQLKLVEGALCLNGWVAHAITSDRVVWRKGNGSLEWHRIPSGQELAASPPTASASSRAAPAAAVTAKQLDGIWRDADGKIAVSLDGVCAWQGGGTSQICLEGGVASMDDLQAASVSETAVRWQGPGKSIEWTRVLRAQDVELLRGFWRNSEGLVCFVSGDDCSFIAKGKGVKLAISDGALALNEWRATSVSEDQVCWRRGPKLLEWRRIADPAALESVAGTWSSSEGGAVRISDGAAVFEDGRSAPLSIAEGALVMNGWSAVALSPTLIRWRKGGKQLEWTKAPQKPPANDRVPAEGNGGAAAPATPAPATAPDQDASHAQTTTRSQPAGSRDASPGGQPPAAPQATPQQPPQQEQPSPPQEPKPQQPQQPQHPQQEQPQSKSPRQQPKSPRQQPKSPRQQEQQDQQRQQQQQQKQKSPRQQRPAPPAGTSAPGQAAAANKGPFDIEKLTGIWVNSEGLLCTVYEGTCTFIAAGAYKVEVTSDSVILNQWRVVSMQQDEVIWERDGQTTRWFRLQHPTEVEDVNGRWRNTDGLLCEVARGMCVFSGHAPICLEMSGGLICLNGWKTTAILDKQIIWKRADRTMMWDRVSYPTA